MKRRYVIPVTQTVTVEAQRPIAGSGPGANGQKNPGIMNSRRQRSGRRKDDWDDWEEEE